MPGRRRQRTYRRRPRRPQGSGGGRAGDEALNTAAGQLAATYSLEELSGLVAQAREAYDEADRQAQEQPGPEALRRYRLAATALAEAQRALTLASHQHSS